MDYYEKCCQYQNIDYRYLIIYNIYIYMISNILLVSKSIGFFFGGGGQNYPPL